MLMKRCVQPLVSAGVCAGAATPASAQELRPPVVEPATATTKPVVAEEPLPVGAEAPLLRETGAAVLGASVAVGLGWGAYEGVSRRCVADAEEEDSDHFGCFVLGGISAVYVWLGAAVAGTPALVHALGDGKGSLGWGFAGSAAGVATGIVVLRIFPDSLPGDAGDARLAMAAGTLAFFNAAGAVLGYELGAKRWRYRRQAPESPGSHEEPNSPDEPKPPSWRDRPDSGTNFLFSVAPLWTDDQRGLVVLGRDQK